ncbi:hypothetical protein CHLRE_07g312950v5 [Chlamydomonas reinhardtii]|uniref:Uncharacterized protein n=1 Tax=Chlamydomonas reinhardtii TaxID=3055 RepID=A0A2K3DIG4_CHLRE|nr:uncharacterized protein CHLRE_07g312950v5 [Chlamydomonas reinhardtii]PNW80328.1 hypothetical protein CHLRE_07g312950v5 [Chlamydomonas reinhardtii]
MECVACIKDGAETGTVLCGSDCFKRHFARHREGRGSQPGLAPPASPSPVLAGASQHDTATPVKFGASATPRRQPPSHMVSPHPLRTPNSFATPTSFAGRDQPCATVTPTRPRYGAIPLKIR